MSEKLTVPGTSCGITVPKDVELPSLDQQVVDFVAGRNDGAALMLAFYGDLIDEVLPPRLAALLERWRDS
jgi:hypothetical protein